jgi:hypothetical protein
MICAGLYFSFKINSLGLNSHSKNMFFRLSFEKITIGFLCF